jgi:uncharacterized membrane protein YkvA (DUF1232 family)
MAEDPFPRERVAATLRRMPAYLKLAWRLTRDPLLSRARRAAVVAAAGYLASPIDLVPGVIPVIGQLDDIAVALAALRFAMAGLDAERRREHLEAVGLGDGDLAADLRTVGATSAWLVRAGARTTGRVAKRGGRLAVQGAKAAGTASRKTATAARVATSKAAPVARTAADRAAPAAKAAATNVGQAARGAAAKGAEAARSLAGKERPAPTIRVSVPRLRRLGPGSSRADDERLPVEPDMAPGSTEPPSS